MALRAQVEFATTKTEQIVHAHEEFSFKLDYKAFLESIVKGDATSNLISLPIPTGGTVDLHVEYAPIMAPELANRYPQIKSFKVKGDGINGRIGFTIKGFHGVLFTRDGTVYIDQIDESLYQVYYRDDFMSSNSAQKSLVCETAGETGNEGLNTNTVKGRGGRSGEQLRTYDLAIACTGEYAQFHGGTVVGALGAMVVTMNRVNGIYEREMAITMQIIGNNDDIIYLNGATDPYSNGSEATMLGENQANLNSVIGAANYDIGHVFGTGGGGIASLGSVCANQFKARGVTSSNAPTGDPFDVDYVAHEMGHQFGANHTQNNNCNRVGSAAFEPGSAATIMGYAGICAPNLQNNSDDYFHSHSLDEMFGFAYNGNGNTCATTTNTGNSAPVVEAPEGGFFIPIETPFRLDGSATDADGDDLTYCWEQMNLGPSGTPNNPVGDAPIFRSWDPTEDSYRVFPRMVNVIIGNTVIGELYPTYDRNLNFRLTVRDNNPAGGGTSFDEVAFRVSGDAGPFEVTAPEQNEEVEAGSGYEITWDVADTDLPPVNCQNVTIELVDYITATQKLEVLQVLAENTPNDGSETVIVDLENTGGGHYIRIKAADNIFFNLNEGPFRVVAPEPLPNTVLSLSLDPHFTPEYVTLNWNDPFTNELRWYIERSENGNQNFVLIDSVDANIITYNDSNVDVNNGHYVYRVYAKNLVSTSVLSNEAELNLMSINEGPEISEIQVYPNPSSGLIEISGDQKWDEIQVFDSEGRFIRMVDKTLSKVVDLSDLSNGAYLLTLKAEGYSIKRQVVIFNQ